MARVNARKVIEDNLKNIEEWAGKGISERAMADALGISYSAFRRYKSEVPEVGTILQAHIKKGRGVAVKAIEDAMYSSAVGCYRKIKKIRWVKHVEFDPDTGKKMYETEIPTEYEEEVYFPPDNTAGIFLLKNWGKYSNEPATISLRKKEIELKEKQIEANNW